MIRYLIKNNFKLMFRNTWSVLILVLGPILVIAVLSSAFSELMKSYEGIEEFSVGYRVTKEADSTENVAQSTSMEIHGKVDVTTIMEAAKEAGYDAGITFSEYPEGEIQEIMENNDLAGFVEFAEDSYVVYTSDAYEVEGITLEYFMNKVMSAGLDQVLQINKPDDLLPVEELEYMPAVDAKDYYGISEIVYFAWVGILCATGVLINEKKYGIFRRFQVANVSESKNYFAKFIPVVLTAGAGMLVTVLLTVTIFGIHWGSPFVSAAVVLGMITAGASMAMLFYNMFDNLVITVILQFTVVWFMGFLGGSFETYMFSSAPDSLKQLSPIYYGNRALVELSAMGESRYVASALVYTLVFTVLCSALAILAGSIRKRGKA